ncbi:MULTISPECIES: hypothetical protein [Streptomyces]|uniref:hypothetical protein n=1 Tax=Streptomyces TaxID=1883 RepID=UPI001B324A70|nr:MULTISPECIES: hypothetical protein [Streptomyces]MBP5896381.1 hypothetical protein [Streptomyces sp. LBUM 1481]MBP5926757.1 hypothetical protein [Streptomyces sp. LBUM 1483]MDX3298597.1 hypothetical protein [Streptomyces scabiei]MDX3672784.1 hypothetical protein [Streptomyces europaeiscabiei]
MRDPKTPRSPGCITALFFARPPTDLITWSEAEAAVATSPHPMSARDLRRKYKAADRPLYRKFGVRGEHVSRSAVLEFHRDLVNGWLSANGRRA